jgi:hypothetical protein
VFAPRQHDPTERDYVQLRNGVANDGKSLLTNRAIGGDVVRGVDITLIDLIFWNELVNINCASAFNLNGLYFKRAPEGLAGNVSSTTGGQGARLGRRIDVGSRGHFRIPVIPSLTRRRCRPTPSSLDWPNQLPPPALVNLARATGRVVVVASTADEYRRRAQQCLEMAGTFRDSDARATLSHMAQVWLRLADHSAAEKVQPSAQQQQQIQPKQGK